MMALAVFMVGLPFVGFLACNPFICQGKAIRMPYAGHFAPAAVREHDNPQGNC
jgi:hypothetical protein